MAQWLGLDPDQGPVFVWSLHVWFPPCPPDSSHSPSTCMFSEAATLNFVCVFLSVCWPRDELGACPACMLPLLFDNWDRLQPRHNPERRIHRDRKWMTGLCYLVLPAVRRPDTSKPLNMWDWKKKIQQMRTICFFFKLWQTPHSFTVQPQTQVDKHHRQWRHTNRGCTTYPKWKIKRNHPNLCFHIPQCDVCLPSWRHQVYLLLYFMVTVSSSFLFFNTFKFAMVEQQCEIL